MVLEENKIWEFVDKALKPTIDVATLAAHKKKDVKVRRIILYGVKDDVVPHLFGKKTAREMWEALAKLY